MKQFIQFKSKQMRTFSACSLSSLLRTDLEVMAAVSERMQNVKNERIAKMETKHRQQMDKLKLDADKYLNERLNALQEVNEEDIQKLMTENKQLKSKLSTPLVTESETQTEQSPQPISTTLSEI